MNNDNKDEQQPSGKPLDATDNEQAESEVIREKANEISSESEENTEPPIEEPLKNPSDHTDPSRPYNQDEQSISGSAPDPEADDDTLESAHEVGEQMDEDPEHPKEVDIGRDVDEAELEHRNH